MFIVQPLTPVSKIRSPLGFMSLSTKWGNVLFPGITVLTTSFTQLALMVHECNRLKKKIKSRNKIEEIMKLRMTHKKLESEWRRMKGEDPFETTMTYWDRYGSMFSYFHLYKNSEKIIGKNVSDTAKRLYKLVFSNTHKLADPKDKRRLRINNARQYSKIANEITAALDQKQYSKIFWWITGTESKNYENLEYFKLCRQLEFALSVWQTYFEISIYVRKQNREIPLTPLKVSVSELLSNLMQRSNGAIDNPSTSSPAFDYKLARQLLYIHKKVIKPKMKKWQKRIQKLHPTNASELICLYDNRTTVADMAQVPCKKLFDELLRLHKLYCQQQGKMYAEYIRITRKGGYLVSKLPEKAFRLEFSANRCGLFGYRMAVAQSLYNSKGNV